MSKLTAIQNLCVSLEEANPELFTSKEFIEAEKKLYDILIKPAIAININRGFEIEELINNFITENKLVYFTAGYLMATGLIKDAKKRTGGVKQ